MSYDELAERVGVRLPPPDASNSLRAAALREVRGELTAHLDAQVRVLQDGEGCAARLDTVEVERFEGKSYAILSSTYRCPGGAGGFEVHHGLLLDERSDLEQSSHANIADYDLGGETGRFVFERSASRRALLRDR